MIHTSFGETVETYPDYLHTRWWRAIRDRMFQERGHECEVCFSANRLHIHHLHYRTIGCEKPADLQILCRNCHADIHDAWNERRAVYEVRALGNAFAKSLGEYLAENRRVSS